MSAKAYIGTSGWSYESWKDTFYSGIAKKEWLSFCARQFPAIEVNATFYGLQKRSTFEHWREMTPPDFRFSIKGNRFLTHNKKLLDPQEPIGRERERASGLGDKLETVLWQMPKKFAKNVKRLEKFAKALEGWSDVRHVLEFRHPSWFDDEVADCLHQYRLAACLSDAADWPMWDRITTDFVYIRLHGHIRTYASAYKTDGLRSWAARILAWLQKGYTVHAYFDNDAEGAAPFDALLLLDMVSQERKGENKTAHPINDGSL
jgi:uncharacterized protein YecE (DUF72 family)